MASGGGQAYNASRGSHFKFDSIEITDLVYIVGLDGDEDERDDLYDPSIKFPLDDDLLANIDAHGVIEPILVTKREIDGIDRAVVVDGRDRTRHLRVVNERRIARGEDPHDLLAINKNGDADELKALRIVANTRRPRPQLYRMGEAKRLYDDGLSMSVLAVMFGVSESTIENFIRLVEAVPAVRNAVENNQIPVTAGYRIARMPPHEQADALNDLLVQTGGGRGAARAAQAIKTTGAGGTVRPSLTVIKKLLKAAEADQDVLATLQGTDGYDLIRWVTGDITQRNLPKLVRDAIK